jgi:hypothetical protein
VTVSTAVELEGCRVPRVFTSLLSTKKSFYYFATVDLHAVEILET